MEREASSSSPMLIATETRKASVHGKLRKPSTNRSEVVKPTSNRPPTISQTQGMNFLSLDECRAFVTLPIHGEAADHRQHDCTATLPCIPRGDDRRLSDRRSCVRPLGA